MIQIVQNLLYAQILRNFRGIFCFLLYFNSIFLFAQVNTDSSSVSSGKDTPKTSELYIDSGNLSLSAKPDKSYLFYETDFLSKEFHSSRRKALRDSLPPYSVAAVFANPLRIRSNDVEYEFHQDPNFYYLTGLKEPNSLLLVFKDTQYVDSLVFNEIIFVQPREANFEMWNGKRLGKEGVMEQLGINTVLLNSDFAEFTLDMRLENILSILPKEELKDDKKDRGDLFSLVKHFKIKTDSIPSKTDRRKLIEIMSSLREIKGPEEIALMRKAIAFTCEAQEELMKALLPGMKEYQAEAIVEYVFKQNGAEDPGFPSILGSGENTCVLHYTTNRKTLQWDDLIICDIGAEYHGYTADVTRTLPADGEYAEEEKAIYSIVLEAQEAGIKACKKGNKFWDPNMAARKVIQDGLIKTGIIKEAAEAGRYFMHGTSHYLGLDVHDAGLYGNLEPGNVITVEPGIYIPAGSPCESKWWNIGIRIEDDILITETEPEILSSCVPKTIHEIEELMKKESLFNSINQGKNNQKDN